MALQFARLWSRRGVDVVDEFFERSWEAEANRAREHGAAVAIQRRWRGYICRSIMADTTSRVIQNSENL
ncbi:hypothetical protein BC829DRAFT_4655 [Chytridium lagenaria]|nr:hypothetical protein BC829DRAFT_4655 [Chytridium lagenaria]